jgi:hypothetical protein
VIFEVSVADAMSVKAVVLPLLPAAWRANGLLRILVLLGSAATCILVSVPARAQEFSADVTTIDAEGQYREAGKLSVSSGKVRFETPDVPNAFFLVSSNPNGAYLIRPAQRVFMDAGQSSRVILLFVSVNPDDPCPQWLAMGRLAGIPDQNSQQEAQWLCNRVGSDTVSGRSTVRFQAATLDGRRRTGWIDPLLRIPLKIATEDGTIFELRNIVEEIQPPNRFEIPPGFVKFDPRQLIERLKKSDVWVDRPP